MTQPDTTYVIKLGELEGDNPDAGSKAMAISELIKSGFIVPPGFILTRQAFDKFARSNRLESKIANIVKDVDTDDFQSLREASERIQALVMNSNMPDPLERELRDAYEELSVGKEAKELGGAALDLIKAGRGEAWLAVRASQIGDFMHYGKPVLNVRGARKLSDAVKKCWASLFSLRAMYHRRDKMVEGFPSMGLVIQKMVDADKSGTIFTYQPENQDRSKVVVECIYGLGQAMLSLVTPDEFVLEKETGQVLDKKIRRKQWMLKRDAMTGETIRESVPRRDVEADTLNDKELIKIWELSLKLEREGGSKEINWAAERGRVSILNSKPINDTDISASMEEHQTEGRVITQGVGIYPGFARGNAKIVLGQPDMGKIGDGDLLVTMMTSDLMLPVFRKVSGIITDSGGRTCHAAKVAREFGIPCIVGADTVTSAIKDDQDILMDPLNGKIYFPEPVQPAQPVQPMQSMHPTHSMQPIQPVQEQHGPREEFTATQVKVNLTLPEMAERARNSDGVGLLRAEHLLSGSGNPIHLARSSPDEFQRILYNSLERIARTLHPKPVFYRSLDVRTDEFNGFDAEPNASVRTGYETGETEVDDTEDTEDVREANPILGWHGIRRSLDNPDLFRMEIDVLRRLHQNGVNNIVLMVPFVSRVEEFRKVKSFLDFSIRKGIMIETPAAAHDIESFCTEGMDFVSIGMDDLVQLVLGVDRDNPNVSRMYTELGPAMTNLIRHVVRTCKKHRIKVSVCGEIGSDPASVEKLVELGVDSVTSDIDSLDNVKDAVSRVEKRLLLDRARENRAI